MQNNIFLRKYQQLQQEIMYDQVIDLRFASIAWCSKYDSAFFNHAQVDSVITEEQLNQIEQTLTKLERAPAVYFENRPDLSALASFLSARGYKKSWEDSWMFHPGEGIDSSRFASVQKVATEEQLAVFLDTFDQCYQDNDPQNPYGTLGDYLDVARESWLKHADSDRIEYFIVYKDQTPVAVATLTNFGGIGYISNVGSLATVRGEGFGKVASLFCVAQSVQNGNLEHALATEEGHYPNDFYARIGFQTRFTALGFVKEDKA